VVRDQGEVEVIGPERAEFCIESDGLLQRLVADGIAAFNGGTSDRGGLEKDDGIITGEFGLHGGLEGVEVDLAGAGPVGGTVDGATVAEEDAVGVEAEVFVFQVALDVVDRGLGMAEGGGLGGAWEAALEEDGSGFWNDDDGLTDLPAKEFGGGGFSAARAASECDAILRFGHKNEKWDRYESRVWEAKGSAGKSGMLWYN
jgi:hypothetical protein